MKVLVIGSEGYVGTPLCRELVRRGHFVMRVDDLRGQVNEPAPLEGSPFSSRSRAELNLKHSIYRSDVVVDLAATAHDPHAPDMGQNNATEPIRLFEDCKKAGIRYIIPSSLSVFSPDGAYPASKRQLEKGLLCDGFAPLLSVYRFATLFGVYDTEDYHELPSFRRHLLINSMVSAALADQPIQVRGPNLHRPLLSLRGAVDCLISAVERIGPHGNVTNVLEGCVSLTGAACLTAKIVMTETGRERVNLQSLPAEDTRSYSWGDVNNKLELLEPEVTRLVRWLRDFGF